MFGNYLEAAHEVNAYSLLLIRYKCCALTTEHVQFHLFYSITFVQALFTGRNPEQDHMNVFFWAHLQQVLQKVACLCVIPLGTIEKI